MTLHSLESTFCLILYSGAQKGAAMINDSSSDLIWLKVGRNIGYDTIYYKDDQ